MKNIIILSLLALVSASCSKELLIEDPRGQLVNEGFFKDKVTLDMGITGLYRSLTNSCYEEQWHCLGFGSDCMTTIPGANKQNFRDFDMFYDDSYSDKIASDQRNGISWDGFYGLVASANFIINGYEEATLATQQERDYAAGQAYFMRAYANFYIVRMWGSAPLVTSNAVDPAIKNSSPAQFYELILSDLAKAEQLLPVSWKGISTTLSNTISGAGVGCGVTVGAAKSLLAGVYLNMAGYPIKDESKYALAAQKAKEVIDNAGTYGYKLLDNYGDLWLDIATNSELIFGAFFNATTAQLFYSAPYASKPDDEVGGWNDYMCEVDFFNRFPGGPRKDATFQTTITTKYRGVVTVKPWQEGKRKHPYYKKMRLTGGATWDTYDPLLAVSANSNRTNQIIRYAEIKLIYAEAQAMSEGAPNSFAYQQVNDIRHRAGLEDLAPGLSQIAFRDSVVTERGWEFAGAEFALRWYDLVRLEMVEKANEKRNVGIYVDNVFVSPDPNDPELPLIRRPTKDDYFAPIPLGDRQLNPNLETQVW